MPRPILLLEINEVPWRLIDHYRQHPALPSLRRFFANSETYSTQTVDSGELSPWITWPTFHRGMPQTEHQIQFLGQDPMTFKGTPIWEEFRKQGHSIGICGSLQSWPPIDPGANGFYVPDTFAHDAACIPSYIEPFQRFNLRQTNENGRVISEAGLINRDFFSLMASLPRLGITPQSIFKIVKQLIGERFNRDLTARRPTFQTIVLWDIFKALYHPKRAPAFSTFFTNHVASAMHRYWHHVFPEDFGETYQGQKLPHQETMLFAMAELDRILGDAMAMREANPELILIFASSMGQAAKVWGKFNGYAFAISDIPALMATAGLSAGQFTPLLAMVPQVAVEVPDLSHREALKKALRQFKTYSGKDLFLVDEISKSISISIITPRIPDIEAGELVYQGARIKWKQAGIQAHRVEVGTAYHVPEGALAIFGNNAVPSDLRASILATEAKDLIMTLAGLPHAREQEQALKS